jgi:hypothetical protein
MSCGEYIIDMMNPENYNTYWERCINVGLFNKTDVEDLYEKNLIDFDEYTYAMDYFESNA